MSINISNKTVAYTFFTNLAINGCLLISGVLTARILQPFGRGELATIILWSQVLASLGLFGSNWALARVAAGSREKEADLNSTALVLGIFLSILTMGIGFFCYLTCCQPIKPTSCFLAAFTCWSFLSPSLTRISCPWTMDGCTGDDSISSDSPGISLI